MEKRSLEFKKITQRIAELNEYKRKLYEEMNFPEIMGSIQSELVRCGKKSCKCSKGSLHGPYYYLYRYEGGSIKKAYICPVNKISSKYKELQQGIKNLTLNRKNKKEIKSVNKQLLELEFKKIEIYDEYLKKKGEI